MSTTTPTTPDATALHAALAELTDNDLGLMTVQMVKLANGFVADGRPRVAAVFHALGVLAAEHQDRRRDLAEHARLELLDDGDDGEGAILGEG